MTSVDAVHTPHNTKLLLSGRQVRVTAAFWSYWNLAAERQRMFFRRICGEPPPWTQDSILSVHRFTNAYRASDRVSQYLISNVIYQDTFEAEDVVLRVILFKIFNRIATWEFLEKRVGRIAAATFDADRLTRLLDERFESDTRLYSGAYIMPSPAMGQARKHANHVLLLRRILADGTFARILSARSLRDLYRALLEVPSLGPFLAYQFAIDLNYSEVFDFDEMDYVVAGPGAISGVRKCFADTGGLSVEDVIRAMTDAAPGILASQREVFLDLWGRPLHLVDCQNLFCEVDKYARVAHPTIVDSRGRTRIKQSFRPSSDPLVLGYPPKWGLPPGVSAGRSPESTDSPTQVSLSPTNCGMLSVFPTEGASDVEFADIRAEFARTSP